MSVVTLVKVAIDIVHRASKRWHPKKQNSIRAGKKALRKRFHFLHECYSEETRAREKRAVKKEIDDALKEMEKDIDP